MMRAWLESFRDDGFSDWSADNEDSDNYETADDAADADDKKEHHHHHHHHDKKHVSSEIKHLLKKKKSAVNRY